VNSIFEAYMKLIGYDINVASERLRQIQLLLPNEFRKWQNDQKWTIAKHHYDNNPFYRKKVGKYFPDRWEDLPIMGKSDYQDDLEKLLSKGYTRKNTYISNTSGSSGHPFYFAKNKESHAMDWALIKDRYSWHGLTLTSKQARFYGIPLEKWGYRKEKLKDLIMNRVRFPVFDLSDEMLEKYLSIFKKKRFDYIYGYTNSLMLFARFLLRKAVVLKNACPTLKSCVATSEVLTIEDRNILCEAFGVKVVNEYGASEVGLLAFETSKGEWLVCEETLFLEIKNDNKYASDDAGGNIIVTDLDNKAMPFVRYNIGDIGIVNDNYEIDQKYRKLEKLLGRENDMIVLSNNRKLPGFALVKAFDYYISTNRQKFANDLKEFVFCQNGLNEFTLYVVIDRNFTEEEINKIKSIVRLALDSNISILINKVEKIDRPKSGKMKQFYSELS